MLKTKRMVLQEGINPEAYGPGFFEKIKTAEKRSFKLALIR